jgi:hypothetical protein
MHEPLNARNTDRDLGRPPSGLELYREIQPMHQNPIVRVVLPAEVLITLAIVVPLMLTASPGPRWPVLLLVIALAVGLPMWLMFIRLVTVVTTDEVVITYRPFPGRRVPLDRIRTAEAIRYNALASGGWGWRMSPSYHRLFNVSGDRGVHIVFGDSRADQFLVGSRRAEELAEAIELARFQAMETAEASRADGIASEG